jgi:hypothetical protein
MFHFLLFPVAATLMRVADASTPEARNGDIAAHVTSGDLLAKCSGDGVADQAFCSACLSGVADEMSYDLASNKNPRCPPAGVGPRELRDVVAAYLKEHPAQSEYAAVSAVASAFNERWCNFMEGSPRH